MYISEIAPLNLRGGLGTVNQLAVTIGLLLSQVLGIEQILGTDDGWPILLGLAVCPAILQLLLLPLCPESPRYLLITKQWEEEARKGEVLDRRRLAHTCDCLAARAFTYAKHSFQMCCRADKQVSMPCLKLRLNHNHTILSKEKTVDCPRRKWRGFMLFSGRFPENPRLSFN